MSEKEEYAKSLNTVQQQYTPAQNVPAQNVAAQNVPVQGFWFSESETDSNLPKKRLLFKPFSEIR